MRRLLAKVMVISVLAVISASAQQFPPNAGNETTSSLGSFKIQITNAKVAPLFNGCAAYNNPILTSPVMFDPATVIGLSAPLLDASAADKNGVPVGTAGTIVGENILFPPPGFPCAGAPAGCKSGANTRELHTEVRSLKMVNLGGGLPVVRAGVWYNNGNKIVLPPARISPGEVESHSGPGGAPINDLPASSFFDVFVEADLPACAAFPGATVFNSAPLIVKNPDLLSLPPRVVYLHDFSTQVPVMFLNGNAPLWNAGDILGYFVLAGHGIGFTNSQADVNEFTNFMNSQPITCAPTTVTGTAATGTLTGDLASPGPGPAAIASPTPIQTRCATIN